MPIQFVNNANATWNPDYQYVVVQNVPLLTTRTLTLPDSQDDAEVTIKADGVAFLGTLVIAPSNGQQIEHQGTFSLVVSGLLGGTVRIVMSGNNWYIMSRV